ncbi:lysine-specific demethylase JMJ706 [Ricinus communis]|uniref:Transcription factor, putative n=1 Tax=Ricinus communis TaxID=3988 RepID=B9S226_RICCO|nr:lysine-specific demethylase JMJ706 [Ricinus communis]EEF42369.1 transcription factor, putative [Ricinus communis]|eukprot:XP_002520045.1 lysine-specific demethylase JMJ706 [Ricinus communis]
MKTTSRENASKTFLSRGRRPRTKKTPFSQSNRSSIEKDKCTLEKYDLIDFKWTDEIPGCPVFFPSNEEFEDPFSYLRKISAEASEYGICKIVSPLKASVQASEVLRDFKFQTYVQPLRLAEWDVDDKVTFSVGARNHTFDTFKRMAEEDFVRRFPGSEDVSPEYVEKKFWLEMSSGKEEAVEYAVNVDGSAFSIDPDDGLGASKWNLKILPRLPNSILHLVEHEIPGITFPMLYIGMLFSMFAWHVEDHYLYSMNYHHTGAPKTWYSVPGHAALQFEKVVLDHVYAHNMLSTDNEDGVFKELAEKTTMFPPSILLQHGVPVYKAVQMPGEFVVTFPRAYHAGFSNGFSCGEAVNFAVGDWFPFGALASKLYARIGMMAILPCEEILCKEIARLLTHEEFGCSSAEMASSKSVKSFFIQHMRIFNNSFWQLVNNVENTRDSSMLLPNSHGTVICRTCKRDCYLAFLECNQCYNLLCHFHDIKSLACACGGKIILFIRENIWDMEDLARRLEKDGMFQKAQNEAKRGNNVGLPTNATVSCIKSEPIPTSKNMDHEWRGIVKRTITSTKETAEIKVRGEDDNGDFDMVKPDSTGLLPFLMSGCKRARTGCKLQKTPTKFGKSASEVPSSA